jgi:hypothetical protein
MMAMNLQSLQMTAQTMVLDKAMGQDAQALAAVMEMMPAQPQLATYAGHMDIRV